MYENLCPESYSTQMSGYAFVSGIDQPCAFESGIILIKTASVKDTQQELKNKMTCFTETPKRLKMN